MKEIIYNLINQGDLYIIIYRNYNIDKLKVLLNKYQNDMTFKSRIEYINSCLMSKGHCLFGLSEEYIGSLNSDLVDIKNNNPYAIFYDINDLPNE